MLNVVNGRLLVYDAVHLAADGSLKVLWDSQRFAITFLFNKFDPPVIDGGQIYVPNYNGGVESLPSGAIGALNVDRHLESITFSPDRRRTEAIQKRSGAWHSTKFH